MHTDIASPVLLLCRNFGSAVSDSVLRKAPVLPPAHSPRCEAFGATRPTSISCKCPSRQRGEVRKWRWRWTPSVGAWPHWRVVFRRRCLSWMWEAVRLEVCGRSGDDEEVVGGKVVDTSATQAALAAATLREDHAVDYDGFCRAAERRELHGRTVRLPWRGSGGWRGEECRCSLVMLCDNKPAG